MRYTLTFSWLDEQLVQVEIEASFSALQAIWRIPLWRPGRYAIQEYPQNIQDFQAVDSQGIPLVWERISTHEWEIRGVVGESIPLPTPTTQTIGCRGLLYSGGPDLHKSHQFVYVSKGEGGPGM